ncbi:nopaline transport system permease protein NocM [Labrys miyagiensis]
MGIDFQLILDSLGPLLLGLEITLELLFGAIVIGFACGLAMALLRLMPILKWPAAAYIYFFRGTPLLVQIFMIYYGMPQLGFVRHSVLWPILREPQWCMLLALVLNTTAYTAEILRGGFLGVSKGLREAGLALGLTRPQVFIKITFPLALRLALPAYGNEMVSLLKSTALASTITLLDVTGVARTIVARSFAPYEIFISAAVIYLALTGVIQRAVGVIETRLNRYLKR